MEYAELESHNRKMVVRWVIAGIVLLFVVVGLWMAFMPKYRIYKQDLRGQAELREAEWTKKISIEEARAKKDSALLYAEAEIERAKGVAEANRIIGDSLKGNEAYLRYLWIDGLNKEQNATVYIPTEAGLPILEAQRKL